MLPEVDAAGPMAGAACDHAAIPAEAISNAAPALSKRDGISSQGAPFGAQLNLDCFAMSLAPIPKSQ